MRVVILNGNSNIQNSDFENYLQVLTNELKSNNVEVSVFNLISHDLNYCVGCWTCWWKTPGICVFNDAMIEIYKSVIKSDLVIFASPMIRGFESALLKKTKERLIPLLHPYIEFRNGESHHKKRYPKFPKMAYLTQPESDTDKDDLKILEDIQHRYALNFHSEIIFFETVDKPVKKLAYELITN